MEPVVSPSLITEIEEALSQVSEIRAARVVTSPAGIIDEIHVLALPSKSPKQLVRDIESTLMAAFGIAVDHKKISIAQLGKEAVPESEAASKLHARAQIKSINAEVVGVYVNIAVSLDLEGELYVGKAHGTGKPHWARAAGGRGHARRHRAVPAGCVHLRTRRRRDHPARP